MTPKPIPLPWLYVQLVNSWILLFGCVIGFVFCVVQGFIVSNHNYLGSKGFVRFNPFLTPEHYYYPTIRQFRSLAKSEITRSDSVLVIIGGDSVMNGVGQSVKNLWSVQLQKLLGDKFTVVNLATRGAQMTGGPECITEYFIKTKTPVIYIGDDGGFGFGSPSGGAVNAYQYWQAYSAGFLEPNPTRLEAARMADPDAEQEIRGGLSEYFRFDDMWSHFAFRYFSTVWLPPSDFSWYDAHKKALDFDTDTNETPSVAERFRGASIQHEANQINVLSAGHFYQDAGGHWLPVKGHWDSYAETITNVLTPEVREHTVLILTQKAPYFYQGLTLSELERDHCYTSEALNRLTSMGITAVTYQGFVDDDFHDPVHLAPHGATKLAELVAPTVLALAHKLYGVNGKLQTLDK